MQKESIRVNHCRSTRIRHVVVSVALCVSAIQEVRASVDLQLEVGGAWRDASLAWDIASDSQGVQTPNVLSALEWQDVTVLDLLVALECRLPNRLFLRLDGTLGNPVSGTMIDADYAGNHRQNEIRRSTAEVNGERSLQGALALGRDWQLTRHWRLQTALGAGFSTLELNNEEGYLQVDVEHPENTGSILGLDSDYNAYWSGVLGRVGVFHEQNGWQLGTVYTVYPQAHYDATARWNLRSDLAQPKSFDQDATGDGALLEFRIGREIMPAHWLQLSWRDESWRATGGTDRLYRSGQAPALTRLNQVSLDSTAWALIWQRRW